MTNVLVFGIGGPAGVNFSRAARLAGHKTVGVDANHMHLKMVGDDDADALYHIAEPWAGNTRELMRQVEKVCVEQRVDFIHSQPEQGVQWLADHEKDLPARILLPDRRTIALTQDKFETSWRWAAANLRPSPVVRIEGDDDIWQAERTFGYPMWIRATRGAGARGATVAYNDETVRAWTLYWISRRAEWDFIAEQYLPGRDFAWTSIWREGALVACQTRERLEYIYPHLAPSGRTGTPTIARTVDEPQVGDIARQAVLAIDPDATGVFCVDLREDEDGGVWPTEINAGRFFTTSEFYAHAGCNFVNIYLEAGMGRWPYAPIIEPIPPNTYWTRHIDMRAKTWTEEE